MPGKELLVALRATLVTLVLTGIAYPLVTTGAALALFPGRARGSLIADERGRVVGSELIAQPFTSAPYLQPRPSAAGEKGYDAAASGGSNLGPTSKALRDRVTKEVERLQQENPDAQGAVPAELDRFRQRPRSPPLARGGAVASSAHRACARGRSRTRPIGDRGERRGKGPPGARRAAGERAAGEPGAGSALRPAADRGPMIQAAPTR